MRDGWASLYAPDMSLDIDPATVRKLDLGTFTGDTWAVPGTLALPDAGVPRFVATGGRVQWSVVGMDGAGIAAAQVADTVTSISTRIVKISRTSAGEAILRTVAATSGAIVNVDLTEDDVSAGDVFVIAVDTAAVGVGSADWLWVVPHSGFGLPKAGAVP